MSSDDPKATPKASRVDRILRKGPKGQLLDGIRRGPWPQGSALIEQPVKRWASEEVAIGKDKLPCWPTKIQLATKATCKPERLEGFSLCWSRTLKKWPGMAFWLPRNRKARIHPLVLGVSRVSFGLLQIPSFGRQKHLPHVPFREIGKGSHVPIRVHSSVASLSPLEATAHRRPLRLVLRGFLPSIRASPTAGAQRGYTQAGKTNIAMAHQVLLWRAAHSCPCQIAGYPNQTTSLKTTPYGPMGF